MTVLGTLSAFNGLNALEAAVQELPHLTLNFYSYGILMRRRLENGGETEYPVSPEQLATALSAKVRFETGLLSSNTLYVATEGIQKLIVDYRKPQQTALFLDGSETSVRVPLPGLVMIRVTSANDNPRYGVYAVKRRPTTLDMPLFLAPLPNMDSHSVCWGSVKKVSPEGLANSTLDEDWTLLLGSIFTSHSVHGKSKSHPADIRQKLINVEKGGARRYPTGDLVKLDFTLSDVIRKVQHDSSTRF
ncbi:MAG: hypothetical protein ABI947_19290 [Chloroflexota bacterium]